MPVLESDQRAPRSALRYRPMRQTDQAGPDLVVQRRRRLAPDALSTTAEAAPDEMDELDLEEEERSPRRPRASPDLRQSGAPAAPVLRRFHPLFWLGVSALILLLLWWGLSQALAWGTNELNNIRYGYPRTFQIDQVVGQGDSQQHPSHFVAINLHGDAVIIDFPGGDPNKAHYFQIIGMLGPGSDLDPVTLSFVDVNHNGHPDMLINMGGVQSVLVNDQGAFRTPTPAEQQQILRALQQLGQ